MGYISNKLRLHMRLDILFVVIAFSCFGAIKSLEGGNDIAFSHDIQPTIPSVQCRTNTGWLNSIVLAPDGKSVLTNWNPGEARLWDIQTGKVIRSFIVDTVNDTSHTNVALSPSGNLIAIGTRFKATIWDEQTGKLLHSLPRDVEWDIETHVTFSRDSQYVMTSGGDGATLWEADSGKKVVSFPALQEIALQQQAYLSPHDKYVLTSDYTHFEAVLWDAKTGQKLHSFERVVNATFTPDAQGILTWGDDGSDFKLVLWDIQTFQQLHDFGQFNRPTWKVSSDSRYMLVRGPLYTFWNIHTGEMLHQFSFGSTDEFFPDNQHLLIGEENRTSDGYTENIYIWNIASNQVVKQLDILSTLDLSINDLVISADGKHAFFGYYGGLHMWNLETDELVKLFC